MTKSCICGKDFHVAEWQIRSGRGKFCSKRCAYDNKPPQSGFQKGHPVYENTEATRFVKGQTAWNKGIPNPLKKENPGYDALHEWVERWKGKPRECESCGDRKSRFYDWANKSGEYLRDLDDWLRLCRRCHRQHDSGEMKGKGSLKWNNWGRA